MRALFAALLAALIVAASERAVAEVTVLSQQGFAEASAGGINLDAPVNDFDTRSDTSLFESFSANVTAVASGDAFPIGDGDLVANAADGGVSTSVQVSRSANEIRVASTTQASAGGSRSSALPLRLNTGGSGSAFFSLQVRVTDRPARFRFEMLSQTVSGSGFGNSVNSGADVTFIPPVGIPRTAIACGPDGCDAGEPYVVSRVLQPGTYDFFIQTSATASPTSGTVEAAASCSYTLVISDAECDLTWNEFGSGGLFSDPANWSPQQAPQDDGAGCNNLLIARNGTFTVAVSGDQRANSMEVRSDAMTLQSTTGGTLKLSALVDTPVDALQVGEGGGLTVNGVVIDASGVVVGAIVGGDGEATLRLTGSASNLNARGTTPADTSAKTIAVGFSQRGLLEVLNGATASAGRLNLGASLTGTSLDQSKRGELLLRGRAGDDPSLFVFSNNLSIGLASPGVLRVEEGARLAGVEAATLEVGGSSDASLLVDGSANGVASTAEIRGPVFAGSAEGATVLITVQNEGLLKAQSIELGARASGSSAGPAAMFLSLGGRVELDDALGINGGGSQLTMDSGSRLLLGGPLEIGFGGSQPGRMEMNGAGGTPTSLTGTRIIVGGQFGTGILQVTGNSNIEANDLIVPRVSEDLVTGNGAAEIADGALVSLTGEVLIGDQGPGRVTLGDASVLTADTAVEIGASGRLEVGPLATVISPRVRVLAAGGRVVGTAQRGKQDGTAPGVIQGDLVLSTGAVLELDADGDAPALRVEGNVTAGGTLELRFPDDGPIAADDLLSLIELTGNIAGAFENITSPDRTQDFAATVEVDSGVLRVRIVTPGQPAGAEGEGEGEGTVEGEGMAEGEGDDEGEGEVTPPTPGCNGCQPPDAKQWTWDTGWGNWIVWFFSGAVLLGTGMHHRRQNLAHGGTPPVNQDRL